MRPVTPAAETHLAPTLTVAAVARRLGVAPATLRTWARRYSLGPSAHVAGAHRRYSATDMARLVVMRRLTLEGVAPAEAARIARETSVDPGDGLLPGSVVPRPDSDETPPDYGRAGGGRVVALPDAGPAARGLARAAVALDARECTRIVEGAVETEGVVGAWERLVLPVMVALGKRWETTGEGIDSEHVMSDAVVGVMRAHLYAQPVRHGAGALLTCAEGDQHTVPLHVAAAALADRGIPSRVLAPSVPRHTLAAAVRRSGPAVVVVHAVMPVHDPGQLSALPRLRPAPRLLVSGPGWQDVDLPSGVEAVRVGSLEEALDEVVAVSPV